MNRQFKGIWIDAEVMLDSRLSAYEKILFAEIDSFTGGGSTYFKSLPVISEEHGQSISSVKRAISKLKEIGYIHEVENNGRKRHLVSLRQVKLTSQTGQIEPSESSDWTLRQVKMNSQTGQNDLLLIQGENKRENTLSKEVDWPEGFDSVIFQNGWKEWKEYKKAEHRFSFKSQKTEITAIHKLHNETNGDAEKAVKWIGHAIANGWKGIYPVKDDSDRDRPSDSNRTLEWAFK